MTNARQLKKKIHHLADEAGEHLDEAHDDMEEIVEEGQGMAARWAPILAVAGIAAVGLFLILRQRRASRLQRGAHEAVDKAFRLTRDTRESARELAERSSRWLAKMPRVRVEMP
jgi:methylthioribose-1-phosphate isomerase